MLFRSDFFSESPGNEVGGPKCISRFESFWTEIGYACLKKGRILGSFGVN